MNIVLFFLGISFVGDVLMCIVNVFFWFIVLNCKIVGFIEIDILLGEIIVFWYVDFVGLIFVIVFVNVVVSIFDVDWLNIIE